MPIPIILPAKTSPITSAIKMQEKSNRFLPNPKLFLILMPITFASPSAGFGINFMPTERAAPIPTQRIAAISKTIRSQSVSATGIIRSKISIKKLDFRPA